MQNQFYTYKQQYRLAWIQVLFTLRKMQKQFYLEQFTLT